MSLSYRSALCFAALSLAAWAPVQAQQNYFVPSVEVGAEYYTNRELRTDPDLAKSSNSYQVRLDAEMGRATPRSDTELRSRLVAQQFPDRDSADRLEAFVDLNSAYRMQKGELNFLGTFARQDIFNSEFGDAGSDFDPDQPLPPDVPTGNLQGDRTRTRYLAQPGFARMLNERTRLEGMIQYEAVRYSGEAADSRVGYNSPYAEVLLLRSLTQRTDMLFGPYVSRYEPSGATTLGSLTTTDSYGATAEFRHRWSTVSQITAQLRAERDEEKRANVSATEDDSSTNWGVEIMGQRQGQVSKVQYSLGRFLRPSSLGSRRTVDQVQLIYERSLTPLTKVRSAVRLQSDQRIGDDGVAGDDRDRVRFDLALTRQISRQWFITGGYRFAWQDLGESVDSSRNHTAELSIIYRGLDPRRRVR